jgi:hypothetical protein
MIVIWTLPGTLRRQEVTDEAGGVGDLVLLVFFPASCRLGCSAARSNAIVKSDGTLILINVSQFGGLSPPAIQPVFTDFNRYSTSILCTCSQRGHSNVRTLEPLGPYSIRASIMWS